jgi:hypothetical protein
MAPHYPHSHPLENKQGLHYSRFRAISKLLTLANQSVTAHALGKNGEKERESAKLG